MQVKIQELQHRVSSRDVEARMAENDCGDAIHHA
jgi:hypothetical protein